MTPDPGKGKAPQRPIRCGLRTRSFIALLALIGCISPPAKALQVLEIRIPLLETSLEIRLDELSDATSLWKGNSDLAELDRATDGVLGRRIIEFLNDPLPLSSVARESLRKAAGSPLLQQALMAVSFIIDFESRPESFDGTRLLAALEEAERRGPVTVLSFLQALPWEWASIDLGRARYMLDQQRRQRREAEALLTSRRPAGIDPSLLEPGPAQPRRHVQRISVPHRAEPIGLVTLQPSLQANGRVVVISHGLWDSPDSFEGWAAHLASHGYTVLMPIHPGSDQTHQQAMLSGREPPPGPEELRHRPLDISETLDALAAGRIEGLPAQQGPVVVIGHSWGATTALQLAGLRPSSRRLHRRCSDLRDPLRNPSWLLQCSFLSSADQASLADPRVIAVAAVSPPMFLLFDDGASTDMNARVLVVSGSHDWVVPPDPEAIIPFSSQREDRGHQLVLVRGGDHFNLRADAGSDGGVLRSLLLAWVDAAFTAGSRSHPAVGASHLLPEDGWGYPDVPLVDATPRL